MKSTRLISALSPPRGFLIMSNMSWGTLSNETMQLSTQMRCLPCFLGASVTSQPTRSPRLISIANE
eukprot:1210649-Pyramimonas_sp.AAC.1